MKTRRFFMVTAKIHIWIGWLIGIPLLLWTVSGLFMVSQPIETVRGAHLRADPPQLEAFVPVAPALTGRAVQSLNLVQQTAGPRWIVEFTGGDRKRADALTGKLLPPLGGVEASAIVRATYTGAAKLTGMKLFAADANPLELRRGRPAWQADFSDNTHIYVDADTGEILALRTGTWRVFDFMWGLHIMDLQTREDINHPILIIFSAISAISVVIGIVLLFRRRKTKVTKQGRKRKSAMRPGTNF